MTTKEAPAVSHGEIARLAYLNWEKDGRPQGRDQEYWLEAEQQIRATGHLLGSELRTPAIRPATVALAVKSSSNGKSKKLSRV